MSYIDGFVIAVPTPSKQSSSIRQESRRYSRNSARRAFSNAGAMTSPTEAPAFARPFRQKRTRQCFSWIEWPDKATRDAAMARMDELMKTDDRLNLIRTQCPLTASG
jgi:uncharacterized protein YbaA (DUF1428 family)